MDEFAEDFDRLNEEAALAETDREASSGIDREKLACRLCEAVGLLQNHGSGKRVLLETQVLRALVNEAHEIVAAIQTWCPTKKQLNAVCDFVAEDPGSDDRLWAEARAVQHRLHDTERAIDTLEEATTGIAMLARALSHPFLTASEIRMVVELPRPSLTSAAKLVSARHPANPCHEHMLTLIRKKT